MEADARFQDVLDELEAEQRSVDLVRGGAGCLLAVCHSFLGLPLASVLRYSALATGPSLLTQTAPLCSRNRPLQSYLQTEGADADKLKVRFLGILDELHAERERAAILQASCVLLGGVCRAQ